MEGARLGNVVWHRPYSLAWVNAIRTSIHMAMVEVVNEGRSFVPILWTGSHLRPVFLRLVIGDKENSDADNHRQRGSGDVVG